MVNIVQYQAMFMDRFGPFLWIIIPLVLLDIVLKAFGLWRSARLGKTVWFIALLLVNSLGILPLVFLLLTREQYAHMKRSL